MFKIFLGKNSIRKEIKNLKHYYPGITYKQARNKARQEKKLGFFK